MINGFVQVRSNHFLSLNARARLFNVKAVHPHGWNRCGPPRSVFDIGSIPIGLAIRMMERVAPRCHHAWRATDMVIGMNGQAKSHDAILKLTTLNPHRGF